jgi:hypothetical protein
MRQAQEWWQRWGARRGLVKIAERQRKGRHERNPDPERLAKGTKDEPTGHVRADASQETLRRAAADTPIRPVTSRAEWGHAPSDATRQRRRRGKLKRQMQTDPRTIEQTLLAEAEREMSDKKRIALADRLTEVAKQYLWRAHELSQVAYRLRTGYDHPRQRTNDEIGKSRRR